MAYKEIRKQLIDLGVEKLADALLELASQNEEAANLVERLLASPKENIKRFKSRLTKLSKSQWFIDWQESESFARQLESLLADLQAGVEDPKTGIELLSAFYESDSTVFERCDDSSGWVGDVFRHTAADLFLDYAVNCEDKEWLQKQLLDLYAKNDYGVRDVLIDRVNEFLPEESIRNLVESFWQETEKVSHDSYKSWHWLNGIKSLAKQLNDARLFEKASLYLRPEPATATCLDIAKIYLEAGDAKQALSWVQKIKEEDKFRIHDKDKLLLAIYQKLGNREKTAEIAWRIFRGYRSEDNLSQLLSVIGKDKREQVIREECALIMDAKNLSTTDLEFLLRAGFIDEADKYLLSRREQLNGDMYSFLLPIAKSMEQHKRYLSASMIYRALLESILRRAQSKYYHHGVRYLKKLDQLAPKIGDWQDIIPHRDYHVELRNIHGRKSSFWSRYNQ